MFEPTVKLEEMWHFFFLLEYLVDPCDMSDEFIPSVVSVVTALARIAHKGLVLQMSSLMVILVPYRRVRLSAELANVVELT